MKRTEKKAEKILRQIDQVLATQTKEETKEIYEAVLSELEDRMTKLLVEMDREEFGII
jgi:BMFP domain-containing protein YqiC